MQVHVREARPEELEQAGCLTLEAYREYEDDFPPDYWEPYSVELANAQARAEVGSVVVAVSEGLIVGAAALRDDAVEPETVYLQMVAVDPRQRRAGIGRAIMDHAFEHARRRGARVLKWNSVSFMTSAVKLYERLGFEPAQNDPLGDDICLLTYRASV